MCEIKLTPVVLKSKDNDLDNVFFDVTLIVDKQNKLIVVDNAINDWRDFTDANTILIKEIKLLT